MPSFIIRNDSGALSVREQNDDGVVLRYVVMPGGWDAAGNWVASDTADFAPEVQEAAAVEWTPDVVAAWQKAYPYVPPAPIAGSAVDAERERRIEMPLAVAVPSGAIFRVNMDPESQRNLQGLATIGIVLKSEAPTQTTSFRDFDNQFHDLLPGDMIAVGLQVAARLETVYRKAWALKDLPEIPLDFADDKHW